MAINAAMVWEIRAEGSSTNGGGFYDKNPGTSVDYSQQDSAQLALTDLVSDGVGTGISSVTGGFTAAMEGNCMYIAGGTGFTTGWYTITAYTDTNTITIDRSAGASKTGGTGNVGGAWKYGNSLDMDFSLTPVAGNKIWIKNGSYALTETIDAYSGTFADPVIIRGYNSSRGDVCVGDNRPVIAHSSYTYRSGAHYQYYNIRFTSTTSRIWLDGTNCLMYNCKFSDAGSSKTNHFVEPGGYGNRIIGCEFIASNQSATGPLAYGGTHPVIYLSCWFHGTGNTVGRGVNSASTSECINCVFSDLASGIVGVGVTGSPTVTNCTFYNIGNDAVHFAYWYGKGVTNNIFHTCGTGVSEATDGYGRQTENNWFYNCTTNIEDSTESHTDDVTETDPLLNDPANDDFTLQATSPCLGAGASLTLAGLS